MQRYQNKNKPLSLLNVAIILLMFPPIPLGLRLDMLSVLAATGFALMFIFNRVSRKKIFVTYNIVIIGLIGTGIAIARGDNADTFQAIRGVLFPIILLYILNSPMRSDFIGDLEKLIPLIVFGCVLSIISYYVFESDIYNSTLDIPYEDAEYKRIFIYPTYLILILFCDAVWNYRNSQILYGAIIVASGSKAILVSIMLAYCFIILKKTTLYNMVKFYFSSVAIILLFYNLGMLDRIADFVTDGDPWRVEEPLAAINRLSDPIRLIFGNGFGVAYWEGRGALIFMDETSRGLVNSSYDVHNGFLTLALKFGVFGVAAFAISFWKIVHQISMRWMLVSVVTVNVYLSHGPIQLAEAIGLGLGLVLVVGRNSPKALGSVDKLIHPQSD